MLEIGFRANLDDFLLDVDVFAHGTVCLISSSCFWELLEKSSFRELTVKAINFELDRMCGYTGFEETTDQSIEIDPSEVDEAFQYRMGSLRKELCEIKVASKYKDLVLELEEYEEFIFTLIRFLASYIDELEDDIAVRVKTLDIKNDLITVTID